jgi:5-methylcytosine-specific restriction endonuclease McrA
MNASIRNKKSTEINHCRAGLKRAIGFLIKNGFQYRGDYGHKILVDEFERLTGLKKPSGIKFRKWMGQLYQEKSPFLPPVTPKVKKAKKEKRLTKRQIQQAKRQDYIDYINSQKWRDFREKAFEFHGRNCASCGSKNNLHVHHKHYKTFKNETVGDVMILCKTCHEDVHSLKLNSTTTYYPDRRK